MDVITALPVEKQFYVQDGPTLASIAEFIEALENGDISDFAFEYHRERKDFSSWISGVYEDEKLAKAIAKVKTKKSFIKKLKDAV